MANSLNRSTDAMNKLSNAFRDMGKSLEESFGETLSGKKTKKTQRVKDFIVKILSRTTSIIKEIIIATTFICILAGVVSAIYFFIKGAYTVGFIMILSALVCLIINERMV